MPVVTMPAAERSFFRAAVEYGVGLAVAIVILQTWILDGWLVPCRVSGGSMAEALLGAHREIVCGDCGHCFSCDAETHSPRCTVVCPNCGFSENDAASPPIVQGDSMWLDRASFQVRRPRRWELVAFRLPDRADEIAVKRVVGLPRERVQIRFGDVYINGQVQRKTLPQQHAMALLVHDHGHEPTQDLSLPRCWRPEAGDAQWDTANAQRDTADGKRDTADGKRDTADAQWDTADGRFRHPASPSDQAVDWLVYHHQRRKHGVAHGVQETPIDDLCSYSQSQSRREEDVRPVADVLLAVRLAAVSGAGMLVLRATDGAEEFEARLQFGESQPTYELFRAGEAVAEKCGTFPFQTKTPMLEISLIDQQFLLACDGQPLAALPFERPGAPNPPATPLAIGVQGLQVDLADVRVYRDVYYTEPPASVGDGGNPPVQLAEDEYFVLGDNSAVSTDSRTWAECRGIASKYLVGKPLGIGLPDRRLLPGP